MLPTFARRPHGPVLLAAALAATALPQRPPPVDFTRDVEPLIKQSCAGCHTGPAAQGGLRLDTRAGALAGGVSGKAIVPGHPKESLLIKRVAKEGGLTRMPPAGEPLTAQQIALLAAWIGQGAPWSEAGQVDFTSQVQPVLARSCYGCHSGAQPKAQLRLDAKAPAMQGGLSGAVIVPGASAKSRLLHRVQGLGGEKQMPLGGTPLTPSEIALLARWIDQGAPWPEAAGAAPATVEKHWSYVKPRRPPLPRVGRESWVRNPIDRFVLARLEQEALAPSPEAPKETLIRRVSLDLIGLPPSPAEVDAFLVDTRPDAYERLVDRLLASPHYGERWARVWLDLARYADTNGFEKDRRRTIWKYRDWVIGAFNRDMPFDRFTIEQIAGDMLPEPTADQLIATGFHRNSMFNEEGGVDKDEAQWEVLVDRVNTTATVWLGSTLGCAQCHNHKYDPFTQKEYYQLMAFFANTRKDVVNNGDTSQKYVEPELDLPTPEQERRRRELKAELDALDRKLKTHTPELAAAQAEWEKSVREAAREWTPLEVTKAASTGGTALTRLEDGSWLAGGANPSTDEYVIEAKLKGSAYTALRLEALPHESLPKGGPGRDPYGNFFLTSFTVEADGGSVAVRKYSADDGRLDDKKFTQLWSADASREEKRLPRQLVFAAAVPFGGNVRIRIRQTSEFGGQGLGRFRLSASRSAAPARITEVPAKLRGAFDTPPEARTPAQKKDLEAAYRAVAPALEADRKQLARLRRELDNLGITSTLILREQITHDRPSAVIRLRGSFLSKGDTVYAGTPAALHPMPEDAMPNRLGLARWLVSGENPLTSRVLVNRLWEQYFGRGLVETSEDFGSQGERPAHPGLLDWLAVELQARKWSLKAMHRLIVTSATYRQASAAAPALVERDPYNKLLARGPRHRLDAEAIRDNALSAAGLLSVKIGGPSVFPPQPEGVWDLPYNDDQWVESKGADRYRRGLYTFLRRTAPYPAFLTFDATSREFCTVRRVRTNTPLQALTTLNDPVYFEAAQALARRVFREGGSTDRERAAYAFRLCVARQPRPAELDRLLSGVAKEREYFAAHPDEAAKTAGGEGTADLAAWTMIANVLLNLDETLSKE